MLGKASEIKTHLATSYIKMRDFFINYPNINVIDIKFSQVKYSEFSNSDNFLIIYKEETA